MGPIWATCIWANQYGTHGEPGCTPHMGSPYGTHIGMFAGFLLGIMFIRFGTKLYRQVVGIPVGTNCATLVADLFLFCYERDFMMSLSNDKKADIIDAFNTTSRYLDDILNIDNVYFDNMVSQIYPSVLQLNKANTSDTEVAFSDLHLSIFNDKPNIYVS